MSETITLGGRDYPVAPLKFRDLKRILPLFLELGIDSEAKLEAQGDIVAAAIGTADPNFTRAAFDDLSPTVPELQERGVDRGGVVRPRTAEPHIGGSVGGEPFGWGDIYGLIATACGYDWPRIDEMTLPQYRELAAYWRKFPPIHLFSLTNCSDITRQEQRNK